MTGSPRIFVAYRRSDVEFMVDRMVEDLKEAFGPDSVFRDVEDIGLERWQERIEAELGRATSVIVAIGPQWLSATDADGNRRLWQENDRLRIEIETALKRDVKVVPVQLDGAPMPRPEDLPEALVPLPGWQSAVIDPRRWQQDMAQLIGRLEVATGPEPDGPESPPLPIAWIAVGVLIIVAMIIWLVAGSN